MGALNLALTLEAENAKLRRLLKALWEADVERQADHVCDLFTDDDPLTCDVEDAIAGLREE